MERRVQHKPLLADKIIERIRREGPIGVDAYMEMCLADPEHGYYRRQPAIGAEGDFVTAPEISQVFGELIGLWCAVVWQQMGAPSKFNLVELGPGRGTLMRDALRATRIVPGFLEAATVHLVDSSVTLREKQMEALLSSGARVHFHDEAHSALETSQSVPAWPTIVIGNEFLDTFPIAQLQFSGGNWRQRVVTEIDGALTFALSEAGAAPATLPDGREAKDGDILEFAAGSGVLARSLSARANLGPLVALLIDYGHAAPGYGDTLQAVSDQRYVSPLYRPGEVDLSAQVDFQHFAQACRDVSLAIDGPVAQGEFLGQLGIIERASRLMSANPTRAGDIEAGVARLIAPNGMGSRFLAIGARSPDLAPLPGLA